MKSNKSAVILLAAAAFSGAMFTASAQAGESVSGFSALQGVTAETMSVDEMQAATGQLNAMDAYNALIKEAAALAKYPKLADALLKAAAALKPHIADINAIYAKYGILTAPK